MKTFPSCLLALIISCSTVFGQGPRIRKSIDELSEAELGNYVHAIQKLRERSNANPADEKGYSFQAALHNDLTVGPCEHGNDLFFAWHRAHLYYFEELLRASDPPRTANVTIPYWDWIHPQENGKFPRAFSREGLADSSRLTSAADLPPDTLTIVTTETEWKHFGGFPKGSSEGNFGRLELGPHNYMHPDFVGGNMADPATAAEDPIYFSFHCFIDLMWAEWQRRNNFPSPTSPTALLRGFTSAPKNKVEDFQKTEALGYIYEYTQRLKTAFGMTVRATEPMNLLRTESLKSLSSQPVDSQLRSQQRLEFTVPAAPTNVRSVVLRLDDLKVPTSSSYVMRVYLHPKNVSFKKDDEKFKKSHFVGYVAMWKSHRHGQEDHGQHHPPAGTARLDLTKPLKKLAAEKKGDLVLTMHVIPSPDSSGKRQLKDELIKEIQLKDALLEFYN